jgi:hypothetical protein
MTKVKPYIFIGNSINDEYIVQCDNVTNTENIVATYPQKFFITLVSTTSDS